MNLTKNLHWFIYIIFLFSCASQTSPTGGPRDTIPPVLERAIPQNEALNFRAKEIELLFSEDIILNMPKEQLIVTPNIGKDYKITYRKNSVRLEFEEPLQDSTTYTFSFRESIQDITEKNPVRNLQLAYSTGDYIDSLSIQGTVFDLLKGNPIKDATVALHFENDTFNILEHPATYFTKTDDAGLFKISHLKPENYYLYAFQDKNRNLIVNSRSESYGFLSEHQYLIENLEDISVGLVRLDAGPLNITSARPYNTYFNIRTTKNLRTFKLTAPDSSDLTYTFGENQANIRMYKTTDQDSVQIHLLALDSIDNVIDTTLYAKFLTREVTPEDFAMQITSSSIIAQKGTLDVTLAFTKPIKNINFDSIYFQVDSLTRVDFQPENFTLDPIQRKLTIRKSLDRNLFQTDDPNGQSRRGTRLPPTTPEPTTEKRIPVVHDLHFQKAAFISVENDSTPPIVQNIRPKNEQDLSIIHIEIRTTEEAYLVQLLDRQYNVIREVKNQPKIRFDNVQPGEYQIRLIIDKNQNGRWDPGNYFSHTEPEPIVFYRTAGGSTLIPGVKANWEIGAGEMFITY